jgi:glycine transporter
MAWSLSEGAWRARQQNAKRVTQEFGSEEQRVLLYFLDLVGVAVFAVSGVLAARNRGVDLLGVIVLAALIWFLQDHRPITV